MRPARPVFSGFADEVRVAGFYGGPVLIPPTKMCPGGLGKPSPAGQPGDAAPCPVCGAAVTLGYAGRIPDHELPRVSADRPVAGVN